MPHGASQLSETVGEIGNVFLISYVDGDAMMVSLNLGC